MQRNKEFLIVDWSKSQKTQFRSKNGCAVKLCADCACAVGRPVSTNYTQVQKTQLRMRGLVGQLLRRPHNTYVRGVLLDFVLVGVLAGDLSPPEALLAQVVVVALLAPVPEPAEVVPLARVAHHRVRHCEHYSRAN